MYLTFILDVSASIDKYWVWGDIKLFSMDLLNFAIAEAGLVLHPDHARVEVITFDDEAKKRVSIRSGWGLKLQPGAAAIITCSW